LLIVLHAACFQEASTNMIVGFGGDGGGPTPVFTLPLQNLTVQVGRNATFTCYVRHIQRYQVGWLKADTKAIQAVGDSVITHNPRVSVSHEKLQMHKLHITDVQLDDEGVYMCQLNTSPMKSQQGSLRVIVPADISRITGAEGVMEGETVTLKCEATGYPQPKVYWKREGKGQKIVILDRNTGRKKEVERVMGNVLVLHRVKRSQIGSYLCIASNGHPPPRSARVELKVNFRPVVKVRESRITAALGQSVELECQIEAYPRGIYFWELESGETLSPNTEKFMQHAIEQEENDYSVYSRLTIHDFSREDAGVYKCVCKNEVTNGIGDRSEDSVYLTMVPEEKQEEEDGYTYVEEKMYEAKTFAPSTRFGQNFGTEYGHSIDMFSSSATYHYPNPTKKPDDISYSGSSRKRRKKGGKRHRQSQERSNSSHINPNYDLPSLAFFVILIAKNLFP